MRILFIHQNFPAQYKHILGWLLTRAEHQIIFLTQAKVPNPPKGLTVAQYKPDHVPNPNMAYALTVDFEAACANGLKVAKACQKLEAQGFKPDIIMGHTGWGELLFVKEVWPDVPLLSYFEYFYSDKNGAVNFDPEFPHTDSLPYVTNARNATNYLSWEACDLGQTATKWQKQGYPKSFHGKLNVIHEGIRTDLCKPDPKAEASLGRVDHPVTRKDEVFSYMARNMEPIRGFHIFMRALPTILKARPKARAIVIGGDKVSYGRKPDSDDSYRAMLEREVGKRIDWDRVHFIGRVSYEAFVTVMQLTRAHVFLTVPFVPSWSMMEAMSTGATVVSSDVAPVREIIQDGKNGYLVDFLKPRDLAAKVIDVLEYNDAHKPVGQAARKHMVAKYDFNTVILPRQIKMINSLLPKKLHLSA